MLNILSTNFGVNPADIQIADCQTDNCLVLDGQITVDTTAAEYAGIRPMKLTVADLPFSKSRVGTAIVTVESDGVKYATITKVWASDKNTINIDKVLPYKSTGSYIVRLSTILIPERITGTISLNTKKRCIPVVSKGSTSGIDIYYVENSSWLMLVLMVGTLNFDETDGQVEMSLPGFRPASPARFPFSTTKGCGSRWAASTTRQRSRAEC